MLVCSALYIAQQGPLVVMQILMQRVSAFVDELLLILEDPEKMLNFISVFSVHNLGVVLLAVILRKAYAVFDASVDFIDLCFRSRTLFNRYLAATKTSHLRQQHTDIERVRSETVKKQESLATYSHGMEADETLL